MELDFPLKRCRNAFESEIVVSGPNAARGEDEVELVGELLGLGGDGVHTVRYDGDPGHTHSEVTEPPGEEECVGVLCLAWAALVI